MNNGGELLKLAATKPWIQDINQMVHGWKIQEYLLGLNMLKPQKTETVKVLKEPIGKMYSYKIKSKNYIIVFPNMEIKQNT